MQEQGPPQAGRTSGSPIEPVLLPASLPPSNVAPRRRLLPDWDPLHLLGVVLFLLAWQGLTLVFDPVLLPSPLSVIQRVGADFLSAPELSYYGLADASLLGSMLYTAENVAIAMLIGGIGGILIGLVSARIALVAALIDPIMRVVSTIPILVAAPFLLIWFGVGRSSSVLLVAFYVGAILYVFAQRAAENLDPIYEDSARTQGASARRIIFDLLLPGTLPEILGGLRIALAGAWGLEAIAELLGAQEGMGKIIEVLAGATDAQGIMAALAVLGIVAIVADAAAAALVARVAAWNRPTRPLKG